MKYDEVRIKNRKRFFLRWLKNRDLYGIWLHESKSAFKNVIRFETQENEYHVWIDRLLLDSFPYMITRTLVWSGTKQGSDFWMKLYYQFIEDSKEYSDNKTHF